MEISRFSNHGVSVRTSYQSQIRGGVITNSPPKPIPTEPGPTGFLFVSEGAKAIKDKKGEYGSGVYQTRRPDGKIDVKYQIGETSSGIGAIIVKFVRDPEKYPRMADQFLAVLSGALQR